MQCDRAQEFLSDYLERTLDRPMTVAIESHLAGCVNCREDVEALQSTFLVLDELPEVEPPADGAWKVMMAIRQERAAQYEAERQKKPSFLEWIRSFNPMGVAMGASLATLVIGGSLVMSGLPGYTQLGGGFRGPQAVTPTPPARQLAEVQVSYGPASALSQQLEVRVVPPMDLPNGEIRVGGEALPVEHVATGVLPGGVPVVFTVQVPANAGAQVLRVTSRSRGAATQYENTVVVPIGARINEPVTLMLTDEPLVEALKRTAAHLGRPVVVDGAPPAAVTLQAAEMPASRFLEELANRSQLSLREENNVYRLTPAH
ncbi:MAG: putative zinc-finger [Armatimonadetes bacterium]|jgi:hypothetical protein|nr:putative zinc-finger [Armatimonadota bacterium]